MIDAAVAEDAEDGFCAALGVVNGPDDVRNTGQYNGSATHGAGFFSDIKNCFGDAPIFDGRRRLRDSKYFGMCGRVFQRFRHVMRFADNPGNVVISDRKFDDNASGRDLLGISTLFSFSKCHAHIFFMEGVIKLLENVGFHVNKWDDLNMELMKIRKFWWQRFSQNNECLGSTADTEISPPKVQNC